MLIASNKNTLIVDLVLGVILGASIFLVPLKFVRVIPSSSITNVMGVTGNVLSSNEKLQVAALMFFSIIFTLILLSMNRRLGLTVGAGVFILLLLGFLVLNKDSQFLVVSYQTFRNVGYLYLFIYLTAHLIVHSTAWFLKRKRKILTIWGVINWFILLFLITYAYAFVTLR